MKTNALKIAVAFLLLLAMALTAVSCTQNGNGDVTTDPNTTTSAPDSESKSETEKPVVEHNRLIYYENFDSYAAETDSEKVLSSLGWVADTVENRAYHDNTAFFSIKPFEGSQALYIYNDHTDGADSYVIMLTDDEMSNYYSDNITLQYDLTYAGAVSSDRYIGLMTAYEGQTYMGFFLRNKGIGANQRHHMGEFYNIDVKDKPNYSAATTGQTIIKKLLGLEYVSVKQSFKDISVSIRYVIDWERGCTVMMRVNEKGYPGSDKWTIVSAGPITEANSIWLNPISSGSAVAIKIGGRQNGYIDNIMIWEGTGEEPADKSNPLIQKSIIG